jgi:hypothetical protein
MYDGRRICMEYFRLEQDKRLSNAVTIANFNSIIGRYEVLHGDYSKIDNVVVTFASKNEYNWFPDVMDKQLLLISESMKDVFDLYLGKFLHKLFCILDNDKRTHAYYYLPIFPFIDCLSFTESKYAPDKTLFHEIALEEEKIPNTPIFLVDKVLTQMLIVNLEVAESILRRKMKGIRLRKVKIIKTGEVKKCEKLKFW